MCVPLRILQDKGYFYEIGGVNRVGGRNGEGKSKNNQYEQTKSEAR